MAAAKDACGLETAAGNGRRLHLGIPEAVFVVRNLVSRRLDLRLKIAFQSLPRPGSLRGTELKGLGRECLACCLNLHLGFSGPAWDSPEEGAWRRTG